MSKKTSQSIVFSLVVVGFLTSVCPAASNADHASFIRDTHISQGLVEQVCELIYQGQFDRAQRLIDARPANLLQSKRVRALEEIVAQYTAIQNDRRISRQAAFAEQLAELEKLALAAKENPAETVFQNAPDPNDPNEIDAITEALSVIAKASEYADTQQRQTLFNDAFVQDIIQRAIDRASQYEAEGKWLDAYSECHAWLKSIDPNNAGYEEYADTLWEKVAISASFEDSPCETSQERYQGVRKEIFTRVQPA